MESLLPDPPPLATCPPFISVNTAQNGCDTITSSCSSFRAQENDVADQHYGLNSIEAAATNGAWRPTAQMIHNLRGPRLEVSHFRRMIQTIDMGRACLVLTYVSATVGKSLVPPKQVHPFRVSHLVGRGLLWGFASLVVSSTLSSKIRPSGAPFFSCQAFLRIAFPGAMFVAATLFGDASIHNSAFVRYELGNAYLPIALFLSLVLLKRSYGILEWSSLAIMTLVLVLVGELYIAGAGEGIAKKVSTLSSLYTLLSAALSAFGSTLMERIYKGRSTRVRETFGVSANFHIFRFHLDVATFLIFGIWAVVLVASPNSSSQNLNFFQWPWQEVVWVLALSVQSWLAGMMVMRFSTVSVSLVDTIVALAMFVVFKPEARDFMMIFVCLMMGASALIFEQGRKIIASLRALVHDDSSSRLSFMVLSLSDLNYSTCRGLAVTYGSLIIFVTSDAGRTLSQQLALGNSMIVSQSMVVVSYVAGVSVATAITVASAKTSAERWEGLRLAYSPWMILKYFPSAVLFAVSSALLSLSFGLGVSASLSAALGYIYMPISAILSSIMFGKYYTAVEWLSLVILTSAAASFGFLQKNLANSGDGGNNSLGGMGCVVLSATSSVLASLVAEKFLKEECLPFHIQKVRLDLGSVIASVFLMPLIGFISDRPQDAWWKNRPVSSDCPTHSTCWVKSSDWLNQYCSAPDCECECGNGFFVAWGPVTIVALAIYVLQAWLTGIVIKQFSTVSRAIAQASTILAIYFIGAPLLDPHSIHSLSLTIVALIVPLSTTIFMVSVSELQKVADVAAVIWLPK
eukprot:TRINITY_DN3428_c0_g2_i1.p1 TRINITY_DN3428_c0_g2~~TRINITY_DN3428_c0_g2_i1.p1  ORF type:complete len:800 (+),score=80.95 TRINITY_DN3428_c0_g2_i1:98-2497(+)